MTQGTTNGPTRGNTEDRRRRRAWLMEAYASDVEGFVRCYRCGKLLYNPDAPPPGGPGTGTIVYMGQFAVIPLTIDRIIPGCRGGTYRRSNIRPACSRCNSETGARLPRGTR